MNNDTEKLLLWEGEENVESAGPMSCMFPYLLETDEPLGAVVICPGGGYGHLADHEGEPVAKKFNEFGFHAFVVHYHVAPARHPLPLMDIQRAIRIVRYNAHKWLVKTDKIAVCGFSAGGHLACSSGVHFDEGDPDEDNPLDRINSRPDAMILCYPVISSREFAHLGSFENLLGEDPSEDDLKEMSLEIQVSEETPPTFLWHTADDAGVPVENSLLFATALRQHKVPCELHVFPEGNHGLGLAEACPNIAVWPDLCATWLKNMNWGAS